MEIKAQNNAIRLKEMNLDSRRVAKCINFTYFNSCIKKGINKKILMTAIFKDNFLYSRLEIARKSKDAKNNHGIPAWV